MKRTTLLRNLIPALIVAVVLVSSFAISAGAKQGNNPDKGDKCGYGYGQTDNDENSNHGDESDNHGNDTNQQTNNTNVQAADNDKACNEDESDENDNGGGDRGGDRDHGKGPADRDSRS